ncbi:hypothetical protein MRB53_030163 [Persea americana]|uniref:Uncharacterized protein n=1 Tax=Persea americana TaxID=3435 RepID=A0ACC2KKD8_PERAE|nr:hypothetical protein MRB53_030163 [Persea americana]
MHEVLATSFKTFVRGVEFLVSPDSLSAVLEIHRTVGVSVLVVDGRTINYNEVARELVRKPINWIGGSLNQNRLTDSYRLLNIFIRHNVNPKGSKTASLNALLPFPGLISKMLVDLGKEDEQTEDVIIPKQKIDQDTFDRSKSHLTLIDLEDDDDDVAGDQVGPSGASLSSAGPSGAGPSQEGHLGEGSFGS